MQKQSIIIENRYRLDCEEPNKENRERIEIQRHGIQEANGILPKVERKKKQN